LNNRLFVKKTYFNNQNIDTIAELWVQEFRRKNKRERLIPRNTALLILDMQRLFFEERSHAHIPSAASIIPKIKRCASLFNRLGLPVILTRHCNTGKNARLMSQWWHHLIQDKDESSQIIPELLSENATILNKSQYDAFYETHLEKFLTEKSITQIVITGVMTHLCCETTARSAFQRGFNVFFPVDGTASYNDGFHRATLLNLTHGFAHITHMTNIINDIENNFNEK